MVWQIFIREWKRIASLPAHYILLLVMPPVIFLFFALIYQKQHAENLLIAVWDEDGSALSRQLTFMLEEAPSIHISGQVNGQQELEQAIREGRIFGAVHFPKNFESDIKSNHPVSVTLYTNSAAMVPAKLIYKDAAKVIIMGGSGVILQKLTKGGMNPNKAMALVQPIALTTYPLYNPTYNYQQYLVPGLITVSLQMMIIMIAVLMLNYEWKTGTMEELICLADGKAWRIILGKTLAHLSVSWVNFTLVAGVILPYLGISHPGVTVNFFILFSLLALACIGFGVLVSALFRDVMFASDVALFYTSPAFVFSGYTFPRWAMPWYDQFYAQLMPYTPFMDGFFKVYFMELPLKYALQETGALLIFSAISFPLAIIIFQRKLNKTGYATIS